MSERRHAEKGPAQAPAGSTSASVVVPWSVAAIVTMYALGLLIVGALRYWDMQSEDAPAITSYATVMYVVLTVFVAIRLIRSGLPLRRLGFTMPARPWSSLALVVFAVAILQVSGWLLTPVWEQVFGAGRDLERFSDVAGSSGALVKLLALSWTVAAFGEELAFRILLMRGIAWVLGDSRVALAVALVCQTIVFGLIHAYQGPAGIAGTVISGLVYGGLTLATRWSIWPAAIAHGLNNTVGIMELYAA